MSKIILVIEDSDDIRQNVCELLELSGYEVHSAINGKEGLQKAREVLPDLILCDIMMPELDGYGVLRAVNNLDELRGTPFVYLTAKSEKSDFRAGMDLGADDYLTKPFSGDELIRVVLTRLKKGRQRLNSAESRNLTASDFSNDVISFNELEQLPMSKSVKKLRSKDMIYMEGDTATHLYYTVSGKLKTYKTNDFGKEYITQLVNPGQFFGHLALIGDSVHHQSAMAIEDSEILMIPRDDFYKLLSQNHELAIKIVRLLTDNIRQSENKLLHLAYDSARKRVAEALLFVYRQYQKTEDPEFEFPVNRENLSAIAGISPESVSRNLSDFKEENLIVTENGNIRIKNFKALSGLRA